MRSWFDSIDSISLNCNLLNIILSDDTEILVYVKNILNKVVHACTYRLGRNNTIANEEVAHLFHNSIPNSSWEPDSFMCFEKGVYRILQNNLKTSHILQKLFCHCIVLKSAIRVVFRLHATSYTRLVENGGRLTVWPPNIRSSRLYCMWPHSTMLQQMCISQRRWWCTKKQNYWFFFTNKNYPIIYTCSSLKLFFWEKRRSHFWNIALPPASMGWSYILV